ncbi:hypothetical protein GH714_023161 [Hevea brasiliensis]|uniref:DUF4216 domain-containing protein n=1 Tax=Hevea brasiliensis TaxID=3981 RepID=A0A6A6LVU5_HEVBR|nr:hypothetical protein GH714_023161 [Hevea brasiliensis]
MDGTSVSNDIEEQRLTQNSGVVNISEVGGVNYYGRIQDIIELNYYGAFKVVMFKCDWFDVHHNMGVKQDEYGFTLLNFSRLIHTVVKVKSRDSFDVVNDEVLTDENFIVPISGDISNVDDHPNWFLEIFVTTSLVDNLLEFRKITSNKLDTGITDLDLASISLEEEEGKGIVIEDDDKEEKGVVIEVVDNAEEAIDYSMCLVGKFLTDGVVFNAMKQNHDSSSASWEGHLYQGVRKFTIPFPVFP